MRYFLKKLQTDASGYIYSKCRESFYRINQEYYTFIMYIVLILKKIKIGKRTIFFGKSYFYRCPESKIHIGNGCIFDSAKFHNMIGVNKCCIISTMTKTAVLQIEDFCGFSGVRIGCAEKVTIGANCLIGANTFITDSDWHAIKPNKRNDKNAIQSRPVTIGNNVFIGLNVIVLKGTEIGDNSVIGAGSVVSGIIPPNVIAAGNPCKVIKQL